MKKFKNIYLLIAIIPCTPFHFLANDLAVKATPTHTSIKTKSKASLSSLLNIIAPNKTSKITIGSLSLAMLAVLAKIYFDSKKIRNLESDSKNKNSSMIETMQRNADLQTKVDNFNPRIENNTNKIKALETENEKLNEKLIAQNEKIPLLQLQISNLETNWKNEIAKSEEQTGIIDNLKFELGENTKKTEQLQTRFNSIEGTLNNKTTECGKLQEIIDSAKAKSKAKRNSPNQTKVGNTTDSDNQTKIAELSLWDQIKDNFFK